MMVIFGTDAPMRSLTVVAADEAEAEIGSITVAATPEGHLKAPKWAVTQIRRHPDAKAFMEPRLADGDTKRDALRASRRRLSDIAYRTMLTEATNTTQAAPTRAA